MISRGREGGFVRNAVTLMVGTAAGQAITILVSPLLARVFTPDEFGTYGVYVALVSIGAVAVTLRYEAALPLPAKDDEVRPPSRPFGPCHGVMSLAIGLAVWLAMEPLHRGPVLPSARALVAYATGPAAHWFSADSHLLGHPARSVRRKRGRMLWLLRIGGVGIGNPLRWLLREVVIALLFASPLLFASALSLPLLAWITATGISVAFMGVRVLQVSRRVRQESSSGA